MIALEDKGDAVGLFADLVSREDSAVSLPAASLAIAAAVYPNLDVATELAGFAELCEGAPRAADLPAGEDELEALKSYFYGELGFHGSRADYYDPRNSFLNDVLTRRCGIPIMLAVVFIEVGRVCGIEIEGVGFPRHFLVRELRQGRLIDVFDAGKVLSAADCRKFVQRQGIAEAWDPKFIESVGRRQMLARILNNLRRLYPEDEESPIRGSLDEMAEVLKGLPDEQSVGLQ
jgi:regulator of sirC expression with transglutaminase-like and TPR domain